MPHPPESRRRRTICEILVAMMEPNHDNDAQIVELYEAGVPVERIKQIVGTTSIYPALRRAGAGPSRHTPMRGAAKAAAIAEAKAAIRDAAESLDTAWLTRAAYEAWRAAEAPQAPSVMRITQLLRSWTRATTECGIRPGKKPAPPVDAATIAGWLREAAHANNSRTLSKDDYDRWKWKHKPDAWTAGTISNRYSWNKLLTAAGLRPRPRRPPKRRTDGRLRTKYSDEQLVGALRAAAVDTDTDTLTMKAYDLWRRDNPGAPSSNSIRNRLGSWRRSVQLAERDT